MNTFDRFLEPISEENPCGEDVSILPEFLELDVLLQGKPETQFSEAEDPDWRLLRTRAESLLERSKNLQAAAVLCLAALQTDGLVAASDALVLLGGLVERYWDGLYPRLDPADRFDPLERLNILSALTAPVGSYGDVFRFVERLREAPVTDSPRLGRLGLSGIDGPAGEAALRDTPTAFLSEVLQAARQAVTAVKNMSNFLSDLSDKATGFDLLVGTLEQIEKAIAPFAGAVVETSASEEGAPAQASAPETANGAIRNRHDVVAAIERICAFYETNEPSSPVPLLLQRAKRLVHSDFLSIMADLSPDAVAQLRHITGAPENPA